MITDDKWGTVDVPAHPDYEPKHAEGTSKKAKTRQASKSEQEVEGGSDVGENIRECTLMVKGYRDRNPKHQCAKQP